MRPFIAVLLLAAAVAPALASDRPAWQIDEVVEAVCGARARTLDQLVAACRRSHPAAVVTSGFHDPRGVSRYRRTPGLHLGYDVAMPAGTPAPAAWAGDVVAITPWTDDEWGITVRHADGTEVTYGHLRPSVRVGQRVAPGEAVGRVAIDHVDVKMRDDRGRPLDFGGATPTSVIGDWLRARHQAFAADERLRRARETLSRAGTVTAGGKDRQRLDGGLISPRDARRRAEAHARQRQDIESLRAACLDAERQAAATRAALGEAEARARRAGVTWSEVEREVARVLASRPHWRAAARPKVSPRMAAPPVHVARLHRMYLAGLISRRHYEARTGRAAPALQAEADE